MPQRSAHVHAVHVHAAQVQPARGQAAHGQPDHDHAEYQPPSHLRLSLKFKIASLRLSKRLSDFVDVISPDLAVS